MIGAAFVAAARLFRDGFPHQAPPAVRIGLGAFSAGAIAALSSGLVFALDGGAIDTFGGRSMIVDYKGRIVGRHDYSGGSSYVAGTIDIEALRDHRTRAQWDNWMKDLRTEVYQTIYEQPIYPKNLYLDRAPYNHAEFRREVIDRQIAHMVERDIWVRPHGYGTAGPGQRKTET